YAGYLFPVLLAIYGVSAFVRPRFAAGWSATVGVAILLVSATGMLARASDTASIYRIHRGGVAGWAISEALRLSLGTVGTWIVLLALFPVGVLFVTQTSYSVPSRALGARYAQRRAVKGKLAEAPAPPAPVLLPSSAGAAMEAPPPLVVKEPAKPKPGLAEKGLAWQETF